MSAPTWLRSLARVLGLRSKPSRPACRQRVQQRWTGRSILRVEQLEDRTVPTVLDLSGFAGQSGMINGAVFTGSTAHLVSGSGVLDSFVRLDQTGVEQGYNTDARPYTSPNDAGNTATFNRSLQLSALSNDVVVKDGRAYYEFVLDANQDNNLPYISLDELRLYVSSSNTLNSYDPSTGKLAGLSPVFDMDSGLDPSDFTYVRLNYGFNTGSGRPDLFVDVPTSLFGTDLTKYVYLYSKFGVQDLNDQILGGKADVKNGGSANDGFEEWARGLGGPIQLSGSITTTVEFSTNPPTPIPPTGISLGSQVHDTSAITVAAGDPLPTGTVTYNFFANSTASGTPVWTQTVMVNSDGTVPDSQDTGELVAGNYSFQAVYTSSDGYGTQTSDVEPFTVTTSSSSIATTIYKVGDGPVSGAQPLGTSVYDTSSVTGNGTIAPTGTITYFFFTNATASGTPVYERTFALGTQSDPQGPLAAGSYSFVAEYNGDSNYGASASPIEPLTISQATPSTSTTIYDNSTGKPISGALALGAKAYDTDTVTGIAGFTPSGTVTYYFYNTDTPVYDPGQPDNTTPVTTQTVTLSGGAVPNSAVTATLGAGSYSYIAVYNGDSNYTTKSSAVEPLTINKGTVSVNTTIDNDANDQPISGSVPAGTSVHDHATFSGATAGFTPTIANVTYTFHNTIDASDTGTAAGSGGTSDVESSLSAGDYSFTAHFSGDDNYNVADSAVEPLTVTAAGNPNLVITKSGNGTVNSTNTVTFTIKVSNIGDATANNVVVSDTLPNPGDLLTWTTTTAGASISGNVLTDTYGDLDAGSSFSIDVSAVTPSGYSATLDNTATATSANNTPGSISASAEDIVLAPSLTVTKTPDADTVNSKDPVGFTITVSNAVGAGTAYGVVLSDMLPAPMGVSWTSATLVSGTAPAPTLSGNTLSDNIGNMAAGATVVFHVGGTTDSGFSGTLDNTATATPTNGSPASGEGKETVLAPSLSVTKTPDAATVNSTDTVSFTITVSNAAGAGTAYGVVLSDMLPDGTLPWMTDAGTISGGVLTDNIGDLAAGASVAIHISAVTPSGYSATVNNTATATPTNGGSASGSGSETVLAPSLAISKTGDPAPVNSTNTVHFTIVVSNGGPGTAYNVNLSDQLPGGLSWTSDAGSIDSNGLLTDALGNLASGTSVTIHVSAPTPAGYSATLDNTATATSDNNSPGSVSASATDTVLAPNLTISKTGSDTVNSTQDVSFTITVGNSGPGVAYNVNVSDQLPDAGTLTWTTSTAGASISGSGLLTDALGDLASGASVVITVSAHTAAGYHATLDNTATATSANNSPGSVSASATDVVLAPSLSVVKTPDATSVNSTDTVGFTITVSNSSAAGTGTAYGVVLSDTLPTGLSWTSSAGTITNGVLTDTIGDLAAGASVSVHISAVTPSGYSATVNNTATATPSNGSSASGEGKETVLAPSLTVVKTPDATLVTSPALVGFTITVSNAAGAGTAYGVDLSDPLPDSGVLSWSSNFGTITNGTLDYQYGDLAAGASFSVHVSASTPSGYYNTLNNTATATPTNGSSANGSGTETVNAPPTITASNQHLCEGDVTSSSIKIGTFSDVDGDTVTISEVSGPGSVSQDQSGNWYWSLSSGLAAGTYTVGVKATDSNGATATTSFQVQVGNETPVVTSINVSTTSAIAGVTPVSVNGKWVDPGNGLSPAETYTGTVDWGDSHTTTFTPKSDGTYGTDASITHTYTTAGSFTITVTISDGGSQDASCPPAGTSARTNPIVNVNLTISGFKFDDANVNKQWDTGEAKLSGWTIYLDTNNNGVLDKEVQKVTVSGTSGSFKLTFNAQTTGSLAYNASASTVQTALNGLSTIGASGVTVTRSGSGTTSSPYVYTVTFVGSSFNGDLPQMTASASGGTSATVTTVTDGELYTVTDSNGSYSFTNLQAGTYHVREVLQSGWNQSVGNVDVTLSGSYTDNFGNYKIVQSSTGPDTLGYYASSSSGRTDLTGSKTGTTLLAGVYNALFGIAGVKYAGVAPLTNGVLVKPGSTTLSVLVDGTGNYVKLSYFQSYANLSSFLSTASSTIPANMLSAQLLATELNIYFGRVNPNQYIYTPNVPGMTSAYESALEGHHDGPFVKIQTLINDAIAELLAYPNSPVGEQNYQNALELCFDGINGNKQIFVV